MLTTIVCLVSLLGSSHVQRLTIYITPIQASDLKQDYPHERSLHDRVCRHLDRIVLDQGE